MDKTIPRQCEAQDKNCPNICWVSEKDVRGEPGSYLIICEFCYNEAVINFKIKRGIIMSKIKIELSEEQAFQMCEIILEENIQDPLWTIQELIFAVLGLEIRNQRMCYTEENTELDFAKSPASGITVERVHN